MRINKAVQLLYELFTKWIHRNDSKSIVIGQLSLLQLLLLIRCPLFESTFPGRLAHDDEEPVKGEPPRAHGKEPTQRLRVALSPACQATQFMMTLVRRRGSPSQFMMLREIGCAIILYDGVGTKRRAPCERVASVQ